jgi:hypothetical protein
MKALLIIFISLTSALIAFAQKSSDVLENGIPLKSGNKVYFQITHENLFKYDVSDHSADMDFIILPDSTIFLPRKTGINIKVWPYNPLKISLKTSTKIIADPINEAAIKALSDIISVVPGLTSLPQSKSANFADSKDKLINITSFCSFDKLSDTLNSIKTNLSISQKIPIATIFTRLTELDFETERPTDSLFKIKLDIKKVEKHFSTIEKQIQTFRTQIKEFNCPDTASPFVGKYIFNQILDKVTLVYTEEIKRLSNLQKAERLVESQAKNYNSAGEPRGIQLDEVESKEGTISQYTVTLREGPLVLDDNQEIVSRESKEILSRTIRIRKFQRFVPEVSIGTAFTFFDYDTYGTTSDSSGQQYVGTPTENKLRNINIAAMLNLNYFTQHSLLHPFYQLGAGINSGVPTLLTGLGIRSSINGLKRLAISGGIAMSWIKVLDKLKVGDRISGTDDIEKDLKTEFSWPPKPYIGIQFNF